MTRDTMAMLSSEFSSRLNLRTKTVGEDRIRRAKENNEDIAVLSMFLPGSAAVEENSRFRCALGVDCRLGDWRLATPGIIRHAMYTILQHLFMNLKFHFQFREWAVRRRRWLIRSGREKVEGSKKDP